MRKLAAACVLLSACASPPDRAADRAWRFVCDFEDNGLICLEPHGPMRTEVAEAERDLEAHLRRFWDHAHAAHVVPTRADR